MKQPISDSLLGLLFILVLLSCKENNDITYENDYYKLTLSAQNGAIKSIEKNGRNLIAVDNAEHALFEICFRDTSNRGKVIRTSSARAQQCEIKQTENEITISYSQFEELEPAAIHGSSGLRRKVL